MKYVIAMRHGHADDGSPDHDRDLTAHGKSAAAESGRRIAALGHPVDVVLCSSATRAERTARLVQSQLPADVPLQVVPALYAGTSEGYLGVLRTMPQDVACVVLVAHNPSISALVKRLCGGTASLAPADFAVAAVSVDEWSSLT